MKFRLLDGVAAASLALGLGAAPAMAQTAPAAEEGAQEGIEDIVVTAQRREENLQNAGIAVSAVDADSLTRLGVSDANDLTSVVPALQVSNTFGPTSNFYLRGVGNFVTNSFTDPAIAFNVDGVIYQRPTSVQAAFFDLERVEVLKGPQGTLYGRNATGGAINLITVAPTIGEFSGYAQAEAGNYSALNFQGAVNIPIDQFSALRISAQTLNHDGYYSDGTGDEDLQAVRAQFLLEPNPNLRFLIAADYAQQGGDGAGASAGGLDRQEHIGLYDPAAGARYATSYSFLAGDFLRPMTNNNYQDNTFYGLRLQADIDTSLGTLTILPGYRRSELDFQNGASGFQIVEHEETDQSTLEVRLTSNDEGFIDYILGAYYFHETPDTVVNYSQQYFGAWLDLENETESWAGFGRITLNLTDRFRLNAGIRYTEDSKRTVVDSINPLQLCLPLGSFCFGGGVLPAQLDPPSFVFGPGGVIIPFQPSPPPLGPDGSFLQTTRTAFSASRDFDSTTYRAGLEYDVGERSLFYASYETGYKAGGFHVSIDDASFDPETIEAYTIGLKNRFFNNRLQLNLEVFDWTYEDQQVSHFRTNSGGGTEFVTENIGTSSLRGAEVEAIALVGDNTTLSATVQYLDAEYEDFVYSNPANVPPATGCAVSGAFTVDCTGFTPPNAPELTVMLGLEHIFTLGSAGSLVFNADTRYQSETYTGLELLPSQIQEEFWMSNLQLEYRPQSENFSVAAFVNNVEDEGVVGFSQPHPRAPSLLIENLRPPQTYGVRVGVHF